MVSPFLHRVQIAALLLISAIGAPNTVAAQPADTLRVIIEVPPMFSADKNREKDLARLQQQLAAGQDKTDSALRSKLLSDSLGEMPWYTRETLLNKLEFQDSADLQRAIALLSQDYLQYRLGKPYKIKPRLVLLRHPAPRGMTRSAYAERDRARFVLSFPELRFTTVSGKPCVAARTELFDGAEGRTVWSKQHTGHPEVAMTDMPLCAGPGAECAITNAIYPALVEALHDIVERFTGQPVEH